MTSYLGAAGALISAVVTEAWLRTSRLTIFHRQPARVPSAVRGLRKGDRVRTYRDYPAKDGTARYDDVWGG